MTGRRGFDLEAPFDIYAPQADGAIEVESEELDRIELRTGARSAVLLTPDGPAALPFGSHFDEATGVFTWQPGVGYVGAYEFQFDAHRVRIVLNPKGRMGK